MRAKTNTTTEFIGELLFHFISEIVDGMEWDTQVYVEKGTLCWISGAEKQSFIKELKELIEKYRI